MGSDSWSILPPTKARPHQSRSSITGILSAGNSSRKLMKIGCVFVTRAVNGDPKRGRPWVPGVSHQWASENAFERSAVKASSHTPAGGAVAPDSEGRPQWRGMSWRAVGYPIDLVVPV